MKSNTLDGTLRSLTLTTLIAALIALSTSGCRNTAHGVGKDIEKVGEKIQDKTD